MARPPVVPGGRRIDLHTHTIYSDGTLSPEALVALAVQRGLAALSITDHDSIESLGLARAAADRALEMVPGIELSAALAGTEIHVLGYYVDPEHEGLLARLTEFRRDRINRALAIVERLGELGVPVDPGEVLANAGPGVVGRPHIAQALVRAGHVENVDEAFRRLLGRDGKAFIPRPAFQPEDAIALVHAAGGVSVLAHPGAALPDSVVEFLVDAGLRGVEVWHPQHGAATVRRYRALATRMRLLEPGGSDYHGAGRSTDLGELAVPWSVLARLKEAAGVAG
jgi:predicted metal-dependent phosphoesterase TrpH